MSEVARLDWVRLWMRLALSLSQRSQDPKVAVGAVVVSRDNRIVLGTGYNGYRPGGKNQRTNMEQGMSGAIHAEINALLMPNKALFMAQSMEIYDNVLYLTHLPCESCANVIAALQIVSTVWYETSYGDEEAVRAVFEESGVVLNKFEF